MKVVTIIEGQTIYDIAVQRYGSIAFVFQILRLNTWLTLDTILNAGDKILIDESLIAFEAFTPKKVSTPQPETYFTTVSDGQNIYDISMQEYGDMSATVQLIKDNPTLLKSFNTLLKAGMKLKIDSKKAGRKDVVRFYSKTRKRINTGERITSVGIGYMGIEFDFIVG